MANYILWGKDRKTGLNAKQAGIVDLPSRNGDWNDSAKTVSLDALMESPTFNEAVFSRVPTKVKREVFSRDETIKQCPPNLLPEFRELWRMIDELDIRINYYELAHNRRKNPPREGLLRKFSQEELDNAKEVVSHWNQFMYLKQRHELIELRRRQYTLRDTYTASGSTPAAAQTFNEPVDEPDYDAGIEVLPLGIWGKYAGADLIFRDWGRLNPGCYNEKELEKISSIYWKKMEYKPSGTLQWIDFRNPEHVYQMLSVLCELESESIAADPSSDDKDTSSLIKTLRFYMDAADLSDAQREILDQKLKKVRNTDIAYYINKKYGKSYTPNYISTIFKQRIIPKINAAADYHAQVVGNLFFPEEFKTCTCCGRTLLKDAVNFTRKARSKDGFSARCKDCEKQARSKE